MSASSEENSNPRKRARVDVHSTRGPPTAESQMIEDSGLRHHETYWFNDGNIVLAVGGVGFRVHKSILSRVSETLHSLVERSNLIAIKMVDGCPVVHFPHDAVGDVTNLISIVYDGKKFLIDSGTPFPLVASVIRLGYKYQIPDLRDYGLCTLRAHYPMTWKGWCDRPKRNWPRECAISTVLLARQTKTLSMLPSALYECCQLDRHVIVSGVRRADDTLDKLSREDIEICLDAREGLVSLNTSATSWLFGLKPSARCESKESCRKLMTSFPQEAHKRKVFASPDLLAGVRHALLVDGLCHSCEIMVEAKDYVARRMIWLKLPTYMGVNVVGWE